MVCILISACGALQVAEGTGDTNGSLVEMRLAVEPPATVPTVVWVEEQPPAEASLYVASWDAPPSDSAPDPPEWPRAHPRPSQLSTLQWSTDRLPRSAIVQFFGPSLDQNGAPSEPAISEVNCDDVSDVTCRDAWSTGPELVSWQVAVPTGACYASIWASWTLPPEPGDELKLFEATWLSAFEESDC